MEFFTSLTLNLAKHAYDNSELHYDDKVCSLHNSFGDIMAQPLLPLESSLLEKLITCTLVDPTFCNESGKDNCNTEMHEEVIKLRLLFRCQWAIRV